MKKITLILLATLSIFTLQNCAQNMSDKLLPTESVAIYDAANMLGSGIIPTTGCTTGTWVNTQNTSSNGVLTCTIGGGFDGAGSPGQPYKVNFNGSSYVTTSLNLQPSTAQNTTWIVWVYPTSVASLQHILSIDNHAGAFNRALVIDSGNWGVFNGSGTYSPVSVTLNTWQQIIVVFTPTKITLYKNTVPYVYGGTPTINNTTQTLNIGKSAGGNFDFFQGSIAWVGIYNRALSAREIKDSCNALMPRFGSFACL